MVQPADRHVRLVQKPWTRQYKGI